jgi:hypothetical protein
MSALGIRSGKLYRSFILGQKNSLTKINKADSTGISVTVGSDLPYAEIHEKGGFIQARKKLGSVSRKRDVYAMEQMFWARYFKSGNRYFMNMALSIMSKDLKGERVGVNIRATQYFSKSIDTYKKKYETEMLKDLYDLFANNFPDVQSSKDLDRAVKMTIDTMKKFAIQVPTFFLRALADNMVDRGKDWTKDSRIGAVN